MMIRHYFFSSILFIQLLINSAFGNVPHPDHVVVVVLENHAYQQIFGSPAAPYLNGLISDPKSAFFTESYGLSHPSQPNYLQFFSGSNQGVTTNNLPTGLPFVTPNLGAELLAASKTFIGYSEDLPSVGYTGNASPNNLYQRKHNPWVNWQGSSTNGIPISSNQPFTSFPSNYNLLPSISIVVPNENSDMHNGVDPAAITTGDTWMQNNINAYIQWAKTNNSLCIITFDEDDNFSNQHIYTLFIGQMVQDGSYITHVDHYNVLRTLEDMFYLTHAGAAATDTTIDYCWTSCSQPAIITPGGSLTICQGSSVTLTASTGLSYHWSTNATTQSIIVSAQGNYSVAITDNIGCTATSAPATIVVNNFSYSGTSFNESMGTVSVDTPIPTHETNNGFDNDTLTMSGTGDVRITSPSSGYTGASGAGNIFLTNTLNRNFIISNINTSSLTNLQLSFGIFKSTTASTGSDLLVQVSSDGINYTSLSFPALATGTGTAIWYYTTATGSIPAVPNLRIQFKQNGTTTQYRIDDVSLKYTLTTSVITAGGPTSFCTGSNVILTSLPASSYNWSNGFTTQNITVSSAGNYFVTVTGSNGCTLSSNNITVTLLSAAINNFTPLSAPAGSTVTINGNNFSGVTAISFNAIPATSFTIVGSNQLAAVVPNGVVSGTIRVTTSCGIANSPSTFTLLPGNPSLSLKLFIEGYYTGGGQLKSILSVGICDTVTLEIHNSTSPFGVYYTGKNVINTSGNGTFNLPGSVFGNNYYIVVYNRNTLRTWSSGTINFGMNNSYDFSNAVSKAYGNNMKNLGGGNFGLFSGDVNQDTQINISDMNDMKNTILNFLNGYLKYDLSGDNMVESADFSLLENNISLSTLHP